MRSKPVCQLCDNASFPFATQATLEVLWVWFQIPVKLEKEMATHSSILVWRIPWAEEPGGLQSTGSQESDLTEHTAHTRAHSTHPSTQHTPEHTAHTRAHSNTNKPSITRVAQALGFPTRTCVLKLFTLYYSLLSVQKHYIKKCIRLN